MPATPRSSVIVEPLPLRCPTVRWYHSSLVSKISLHELHHAPGSRRTIEGSRRERLVLRPLTLDDLHDVALLHSQESFWHYPFRRSDALVRRDDARLAAAVPRHAGARRVATHRSRVRGHDARRLRPRRPRPGPARGCGVRRPRRRWPVMARLLPAVVGPGHSCPIVARHAVGAPSTQTADRGGSAVSCDFSWGDRGDLNPRPSGPQPDALTT
jgi:hypothetical protein